METSLSSATEVAVPRLRVNVRYGDSIEALVVNEHIIIDNEDQKNILTYTKRRYGTARTFSTKKDSYNVTRLFRLK